MFERRCIAGAALMTIGLLGAMIGRDAGLAELARPWAFLSGFAFGLITGSGAVLSLSSVLAKLTATR